MTTDEVVLEVRLPRELALAMQTAGLEETALPDEMRKALAISLFRRGLFSIGKAAELAGVPLAEFMELLVENRVPVAEYSPEEVERDAATIERAER
ncbi:MAG: UPF0175 family protein [Chloroflexi bacterium]|nr:MAG: UPF0175 family protein [Chloroflexota bacterium]